MTNKTFARASALLLLLALPSACASDNAGTGAAGLGSGSNGMATASLKGPLANEALSASVLWQVNTGSDYTYILGGGTVSRGQASVEVPLSSGGASVDPLALNESENGSSVGVGYLIVTRPEDAPKQASKVDDDELKMKGISARYAFIFRKDDGERVGFDWAKAFPQGLSCGRCVAKTGQQGAFDSWEPVPCASIEIDTAEDIGSLDVCNWT